jgi:hypothetical protein
MFPSFLTLFCLYLCIIVFVCYHVEARTLDTDTCDCTILYYFF